MKAVDIYAINQSNGFGDYKLAYICGNLRQIGQPSQQEKAVAKRFIAADGTVIQYAGYHEMRMTLLLETSNKTEAYKISSYLANGAFAIYGEGNANITKSGTLYYIDGDVTITRVSNSCGFWRVEIPLLRGDTNVSVPMIILQTDDLDDKDDKNGFRIKTSATNTYKDIYLRECVLQEDGSYRYPNLIHFPSNVKTAHIIIDAKIGEVAFHETVDGTEAMIGITPIVNGTRFSIIDFFDVSPEIADCTLVLRSLDSVKWLTIHFKIWRDAE